MEAVGHEKRNLVIRGTRTIRRDDRGRETGFTETTFTQYVAPDGSQVRINATTKVTFQLCPETGIPITTTNESWSSAAEGQETTTDITTDRWDANGRAVARTLRIRVRRADGTIVEGTEVQTNITYDANGNVIGYDFERSGELFAGRG